MSIVTNIQFNTYKKVFDEDKYLKKLNEILKGDLNFHDQISGYSTHNFHSFPAKFPPQLPRKFILELTEENDVVLDPMVGSGTTLIECLENNRYGIGFDIDPLALMISEVKTNYYNKNLLINLFNNIVDKSVILLKGNVKSLNDYFNSFENQKKEFIQYWFSEEAIQELTSLLIPISEIDDKKYRNFFSVLFSSIIITKSGGVSLALDLAHTRPHRAKKVVNFNSEILFDNGNYEENPRHNLLFKKIKSPLNEFKKKFYTYLEDVREECSDNIRIEPADSQELPLQENYVDLIVTSPPYASNAIDYMRAHKFSLLWFDFSIDDLKQKRAECIGGESVSKINFEKLPDYSNSIVNKIAKINLKKSIVLQRYFSEMTRVLKEMYRVIKPNRTAVVVVGNSVFNGISTDTHICLQEIGENIGFSVPHIGVRSLDRNRRMLPTSNNVKDSSNIQKRMIEEYVIGFYKNR